VQIKFYIMRTLIVLLFISLTSLFAFKKVNNSYYGFEKFSSLLFVVDESVKNNVGSDISANTIEIFRKADSNSDRIISVNELQIFQNWLKRSFKYKENNTALHPDDFITQGGGDCEDFAIMTTCMLNYHGVVAYVAGFGRVTVNKHAVCIVQVSNDKTPGYMYYTLSGWGIPSGIYIPIDYEKVGGLSAIDRRWKIARISRPISIYGVYM
jgi:hypothetical protein